jgi:Ca-activated chloride channel homolog
MDIRPLGSLAILASLAVAAFAQEPAAPVFRSTTDLVIVTATVTTRDGQPARGLLKEAFTITEDGAPQTVSVFDTGDVPLSIGLLVDTSGSMSDKLEDVQDALRHFVDTLRNDDEIFLMEFAEGVRMVANFDDGRDSVRRAIRQLDASGGTALYDGTVRALDALARARHRRRALVLITDGNDTDSRTSSREATNAARRSEAIVYALGIGHGSRGSFGHLQFGSADAVDMGTLRRLSDPGGGRSYRLENAHAGGIDAVEHAIAEIGAELRQQYTLGYSPANTGKSGFRRIEVRVADPTLRVRARSGYWSDGTRTR